MPLRRRTRAAALMVALVMSVAVLAGCSAEPTAPSPPRPAPLKILLVNDGGWNAPGIVAMREALSRAGHEVMQVAPITAQDNAGTATTERAPVFVRRPTRNPNIVTVSGTPSDAVLISVRSVFYPDLVISGVNPERHVGLMAMQSGSVGAAMTAAALNFPSLVVSTDVADPRRPKPSEFARPADFTVKLVDAIVRQRPANAPLLPERTVLNVNYPGGPDRPRGVIAAPTADIPTTVPSYRIGADPTVYLPDFAPQRAPGGDNDATALASGRITLTDLTPDPDRSDPPPRAAARLAPTLSP